MFSLDLAWLRDIKTIPGNEFEISQLCMFYRLQFGKAFVHTQATDTILFMQS